MNEMFHHTNRDITIGTRSDESTTPHVCQTKLQVISKNLRIRGARYFNELPPEVRSAPSYDMSKKRIGDYNENVLM